MSVRHRRLQRLEQSSTGRLPRAVSLRVACDRLGMSLRTGERRLQDGTFPIPELPRTLARRGSPHLFSSHELDAYLRTASVADVR